MRKLRLTRVSLAGVSILMTLLSLAPAAASSANLSHSYHSTAKVPSGSIVSVDPNKSDYVQLANTSNGSKVLGVAVPQDDSLLAVDPSSDKVQVATSGNVNTLVSNLGGNIRIGDQISVSPFNGIGMRAELGSHVIGLAQTSLASTSDGATAQKVTDKDGKSKDILVGYVRISISVGDTVSAEGVQLNSLQKLGKSLTGHTISTIRILISMAVALIATVALITLIYASIYGSIISVGRNPLAKYAVFRTLAAVLGMAAMTTLIAGTTIFLLLR